MKSISVFGRMTNKTLPPVFQKPIENRNHSRTPGEAEKPSQNLVRKKEKPSAKSHPPGEAKNRAAIFCKHLFPNQRRSQKIAQRFLQTPPSPRPRKIPSEARNFWEQNLFNHLLH